MRNGAREVLTEPLTCARRSGAESARRAGTVERKALPAAAHNVAAAPRSSSSLARRVLKRPQDRLPFAILARRRWARPSTRPAGHASRLMRSLGPELVSVAGGVECGLWYAYAPFPCWWCCPWVAPPPGGDGDVEYPDSVGTTTRRLPRSVGSGGHGQTRPGLLPRSMSSDVSGRRPAGRFERHRSLDIEGAPYDHRGQE